MKPYPHLTFLFMGFTPASSHFPTIHTFPSLHPKSEINYRDWWFQTGWIKGIIILQCGKVYIYSVSLAQDKKVFSVVLYSPICKESSLPCRPPRVCLIPMKHVHWHTAGYMKGKGVLPFLRSSAPSCCQYFSLSWVVSEGRRCPVLGLKPRAHLYGHACREWCAKQACRETKILWYSEARERQFS